MAASFQEPSGIPTAETLERLRAAVSKENTESPMPQNDEQPSEIERPKFGISSLISRMSRGEGSDISSEPRKEPNFNSTDGDNCEQDKIDVPAFYEGKLTNCNFIVNLGCLRMELSMCSSYTICNK